MNSPFRISTGLMAMTRDLLFFFVLSWLGF